MIYPVRKFEKIRYSEILTLLFILTIYFAVRLFFALGIPIHPDEAYYWAWSMHPDLAYYDQGPGVAYYILLFTSLFGDQYIALKISALVSIFPVVMGTYFTARELNLGIWRSSLAAFGMLIFPGAFAGISLIMHDTPLLIFWSLGLYCWTRYLRRRENSFLFLTFLCMGLGALCKHTMGGFALSLLLWFAWQPREFGLLRKRNFWLGILLTLLCLCPILIWNQNHNWDQIGAIVHLRSSGGASASGSAGQMLLGQMLIISPFWFLAYFFLICLIVFHFLRKFSLNRWLPDTREMGLWDQFKSYLRKIFSDIKDWFVHTAQQNRNSIDSDPDELNYHSAYWFVFWNALVLPVFFLILARNRTIQPNWVIPSYPAIFIMLAGFFPKGKIDLILPGWARKTYRFLLIAGLLPLLFINIYPFAGRQMVEAMGGKMPARNYLQYRTVGFKEIISELDQLRKQVDPQAGIATNRYQDAAIAQWYLPDHEYVPSLNISQKNQYSYWSGLEKGKNYFVVSIQEDASQRVDFMLTMWFEYMFESTKKYPVKTIDRDGMAVKKYQIWYVKNYKVEWYEVLALYMDKFFILDIMSSMRGYSRLLNKQNVLSEMQKFSRQEGVCIAQPAKGALDMMANIALTGKTYSCFTPNLEALEKVEVSP